MPGTGGASAGAYSTNGTVVAGAVTTGVVAVASGVVVGATTVVGAGVVGVVSSPESLLLAHAASNNAISARLHQHDVTS